MKYIKKFEDKDSDWENMQNYLWNTKVEICKIWPISAFAYSQPNKFILNKQEIYDYYYKLDPQNYIQIADKEYKKMQEFLVNRGFTRIGTDWSGNPNRRNGDIYSCDLIDSMNKYNL